MTRVTFYVLKNTATDRQAVACRLAEKAYLNGHHVFIHTSNQAETDNINDLLWSMRAESFVPHEVHTAEATEHHTPVLIAHQAEPPRLMDVMINLNPEQPLFFSQFDRLLELVDDDETIKQAGRKRYQFYKDRGYQLDTVTV